MRIVSLSKNDGKHGSYTPDAAFCSGPNTLICVY